MYARLNVGCTKPDIFSDGAPAAFFEGLQYAAPIGIGDGVQHAV